MIEGWTNGGRRIYGKDDKTYKEIWERKINKNGKTT